jgi:hypothetical protein
MAAEGDVFGERISARANTGGGVISRGHDQSHIKFPFQDRIIEEMESEESTFGRSRRFMETIRRGK